MTIYRCELKEMILVTQKKKTHAMIWFTKA